MPDRKKIAVIVAGGSGLRMGSPIPKQFMEIGGKPVLHHTINAFRNAYPDIRIVLVIPEAHSVFIAPLLVSFDAPPSITIVHGGETRFHSVKNGLAAVTEPAVVFVHDGVRALLSAELVRRCCEGALAKGNAIPAIEVKDSLREVDDEGNLSVDRSRFRIIQTPQTFLSEQLLPAFEQPYDPLFTDEASVAERFGAEIHLVEGEERNIKITRPLDLAIAEVFLSAK